MTTMSSEYQLPENVTLLPQTAQLLTLLTILRDRETSAVEFARNAERVARVLVSEGVCIFFFFWGIMWILWVGYF